MKPLFSLLFALILVLGACKNQQKNAATQRESGGSGLQWTEVVSGSYCAIDTERQQMIRTEQDWASLWQELQANVDPTPPLPVLNFDQQVVIACFIGTRNSGGYSVEVSGMELKDKVLHVKLVNIEPGKNCVATMALTQPYTIVVLENPGAESASFTSETRKLDCDK